MRILLFLCRTASLPTEGIQFSSGEGFTSLLSKLFTLISKSTSSALFNTVMLHNCYHLNMTNNGWSIPSALFILLAPFYIFLSQIEAHRCSRKPCSRIPFFLHFSIPMIAFLCFNLLVVANVGYPTLKI